MDDLAEEGKNEEAARQESELSLQISQYARMRGLEVTEARKECIKIAKLVSAGVST